MKRYLFSIIIVSLAASSMALAKAPRKLGRMNSKRSSGDLTQQLDQMNSDQDVMRRAKEMSTDSRVEVVQNRAVDRTNKHEFTGNFGAAAFGDTYLQSMMFGAQYDYHITNHWSLGARYYSYRNSFTSEGESVMKDAAAKKAENRNYRYPQVDEPQYASFATVTWYPIYGKSNMFNLDVVHFDFYTLGGIGRMQLSSGGTTAFTAGGGLGIWWNQWLTSRLELRWQGYEDKHFDGTRRLNVAVATFGMGVMF